MSGSSASLGQFNTTQMAQLFNAIMPLVAKASGAAIGGKPLTTDVSGLMPNQGWYSGVDESIKQGMWEPVNEGARNMINTMGGTGMLSGRGGYSGMGQTALADYYQKAATQQGLNTWNIMNPIQQLGYTNPWSIAAGYAGTGAGLTPNPVVKPGEQSAFSTYAPMAGMALGGSLLNNLKWGNIFGGQNISSWW